MRKILLSFVILIGLLYSQEVPFNIPQGKVDDIKEIFEKGFGYKVADKSLGIKDRFDLVAPRALNFQQAFHFVNTRLQEKGYTFILDRKWKVIEIWEISRVDRSKLESFFLPDINTLKDRIDKGTLFESEIVQATIKSEKIDAGSLARELSRELKFPEWVIIEPDMTANVVKTVSTVAQLMKMLEQKEPIEKTIGKEIEGKLVRVFQVKNIKALAAFQILVDLLHLEIITPVEPKEEKQQPGGTQPGGTQPGEAPTRPRGEGGGGGRPSFPFDISSLIKKGGKAGTVIEGGGLGPVAKGTIKEKDDIFVYVDQETNSLIVVAKREHVEKVEQLLRLIDFEPPSKAVPALPHYEVYPLKYARAREAVQILTSSFMSYYGVVLGGAVVTTLNAGFEIEMVKPTAETGSRYTPSVSASGAAPSAEKVRKIEPPDEKTYSLARGIIPGKIAFIAEDRSNSIIIFATGAEIELARTLLKQIDKEGVQVLIEVIIAEVTLEKEWQFGIAYRLKNQVLSGAQTGGSEAGIGIRHFESGVPEMPTVISLATGEMKEVVSEWGNVASPIIAAAGKEKLSIVAIAGEKLNAFLKLLAKETKIDIISSPKILTENNRVADFKIEDVIPWVEIKQSSERGWVNREEYSETWHVKSGDGITTGTFLTIIPHVNENNVVVLEIYINMAEAGQRVKEMGPAPVNSRVTSVTVVTKSGEAIILGGFMKNTKQLTKYKIPILGDIPLIGTLFSDTSTTNVKKETVFFVIPTVIKNSSDLYKIKEEHEKKSTVPWPKKDESE